MLLGKIWSWHIFSNFNLENDLFLLQLVHISVWYNSGQIFSWDVCNCLISLSVDLAPNGNHTHTYKIPIHKYYIIHTCSYNTHVSWLRWRLQSRQGYKSKWKKRRRRTRRYNNVKFVDVCGNFCFDGQRGRVDSTSFSLSLFMSVSLSVSHIFSAPPSEIMVV